MFAQNRFQINSELSYQINRIRQVTPFTMRPMHVRKQYIVPLAALVISLGIILANLLAVEPLTADEIVAKSREHFEAASSYQAMYVQYSPADGEPIYSAPTQMVRPDKVVLLDNDGIVRSKLLDEMVYSRSESQPDKWVRRAFPEGQGPSRFDLHFPSIVYDAEFISTTSDEYFMIEGWAGQPPRVPVPPGVGHPPLEPVRSPYVRRIRLQISTEDYALWEYSMWSTFEPAAQVDEDGVDVIAKLIFL
jgi:hypothetical protein